MSEGEPASHSHEGVEDDGKSEGAAGVDETVFPANDQQEQNHGQNCDDENASLVARAFGDLWITLKAGVMNRLVLNRIYAIFNTGEIQQLK